MKRISSVILIIIMIMTATLITGCSSKNKSSNNDNKKSIVTTSFVGYDLATQIAGDKATVTNVIPWGSELHNFEPTAKNRVDIEEADLFIYLSLELEPWVKSSKTNKNAINLSKSYTESDHEEEEASHGDEEAHAIHFWTDPEVYLQLIEKTKESLIAIDPENKQYYEKRAEKYYTEISDLNQGFKTYTESLDNKNIYFAGHNAMGPFAERYNLKITSLSDEVRPDADITGKQMTALKNAILNSNTKYLFTEELVDPKIANQIKKSVEEKNHKLTILELHGYHNISKEQHDEGVTYAALFKRNIENLKKALNS